MITYFFRLPLFDFYVHFVIVQLHDFCRWRIKKKITMVMMEGVTVCISSDRFIITQTLTSERNPASLQRLAWLILIESVPAQLMAIKLSCHCLINPIKLYLSAQFHLWSCQCFLMFHGLFKIKNNDRTQNRRSIIKRQANVCCLVEIRSITGNHVITQSDRISLTSCSQEVCFSHGESNIEALV